jgi:hypothetical protein
MFTNQFFWTLFHDLFKPSFHTKSLAMLAKKIHPDMSRLSVGEKHYSRGI